MRETLKRNFGFFMNWQNLIKDDHARPESSNGSEGGGQNSVCPTPLVAPLIEEECRGKGVGKEEVIWNVGGGGSRRIF